MTNEELCILIKNGDDGYLPQLWEQTRRLIVMKAKQRYESLENKHGTELDDLIQSGYLAVLEAVKYYDPVKGFKFTTYLTNTLKTAFNEVLGIRTVRRNPLNYCDSLDRPIGEDGDMTLLDTIGDMTPGRKEIEADIVESVYHQELRAALDNALKILPDDSRQILELHFYFDISAETLAENLNISHQGIFNKMANAYIRILGSSHMKILRAFLYDEDPDFSNGAGYLSWRDSGMSTEEKFVIYQEERNNAGN